MEEIRLRGEYFREYLQKGIREIYDAQRSVAATKLGSGQTGRKSRGSLLMESLVNPDYSLTVQGGGVHAVLNYPKEIRFQDMRHLGNWKIYNRQIWGILYRRTFQDMRYEFSDWLRHRVVSQLTEALQPLAPQ